MEEVSGRRMRRPPALLFIDGLRWREVPGRAPGQRRAQPGTGEMITGEWGGRYGSLITTNPASHHTRVYPYINHFTSFMRVK